MYDLTKSEREREGLLFGCFNLSLGGGGGGSIQSHFVTDISVKFGIPNSLQVPDIGVFPISSQSHIKESCHDSRTSHDIDMELRPVTKLDKKNKTTSKKIDDDVMSVNCDFIVNFPIFV